MAELIVLSATQVGAGDQAYVSFHLPVAATLVGVTVAGVNVVGAPTTGFVSVNEPVLDEVCTVHIKWANAWTGDWRSRHLGGTETPVPLSAGTALDITLYLSGGVNPTPDLTTTLWLAV